MYLSLDERRKGIREANVWLDELKKDKIYSTCVWLWRMEDIKYYSIITKLNIFSIWFIRSITRIFDYNLIKNRTIITFSTVTTRQPLSEL